MIGPGKRGGGHSGRDTPGLFPFRTRKLRLPAPMVLHPPGCGRVGHRRLHTTTGGARHGPPLLFFPYPHTHTGPHTPQCPTARGHTGHTGHTHGAIVNPTRTGPHKATVPHGHTRKHSMSTQVDAVGYETCV